MIVRNLYSPASGGASPLRYNLEKVMDDLADVVVINFGGLNEILPDGCDLGPSYYVDPVEYTLKREEREELLQMYSNPSLAEVCQQLREYEKANQRTLRPWLHITVGPGASDELSEEDLKKFITDFMDELGYGDQPYIVFLHYDIDRKHYHIVSVNVDREGNKVITTREDDQGKRKPYKLDKRLCNEVLKKLQKKYKYEIGTGEELAQAPERFDPKAGNIKQQIDAIIKEEMKNPYINGIGPLCNVMYLRGVDLSYVTSRKNLELKPTTAERAANVFIAKGLDGDGKVSKTHPRIYDSRESKALYSDLYKTNRGRLECLLYVTRALEGANSMKEFTDSLAVRRSEEDSKAIVKFREEEYEADDILPGLNKFLKDKSEKDFAVRKKQLVNRQKNLENYRRIGEMLPEDYLAVKLQDVVDVMNRSEISRDPNSGLTLPVTGLWIAVEKNPDQVVEDKWTGPGRVCVALVDSKERWLKFNSDQNGDIILRPDADSEKRYNIHTGDVSVYKRISQTERIEPESAPRNVLIDSRKAERQNERKEEKQKDRKEECQKGRMIEEQKNRKEELQNNRIPKPHFRSRSR